MTNYERAFLWNGVFSSITLFFEEYGIPFATTDGFSYMTIGYCPRCGKELPLSKREQVIKAQQEAAKEEG